MNIYITQREVASSSNMGKCKLRNMKHVAITTKTVRQKSNINYCESTIVRGVPIFVVFVGIPKHEILFPT